MFCTKCGTKLDENALFCSNCGTAVLQAEEQKTANVTQEDVETLQTESAETEEGIDTTFEGVNEENPQKVKIQALTKLLTRIGQIAAVVGVALFVGIVAVSLIGWGEIYLFGGYEFTKVLAIISLCLMLAGVAALGASLALKVVFKIAPVFESKKVLSLTAALLACSVGFSVWGFIDCANEKENDSYSGSGSGYGGSYGGGYASSGIPKELGLTIKVDRIEKSGSYTYVYCSVKNVSNNYGVAMQYRYVKVKAQFKNASGTIVDTDWVYAIDSGWLDPGETKTFYYMVKDTTVKSATLSFMD